MPAAGRSRISALRGPQLDLTRTRYHGCIVTPTSSPVDPERLRDDVRRYYDVNTAFFRLFGGDRGTQTVHRSVWADGVRTLDEALSYTNTLVLDQARRLAAPRPTLGDLGCGTGGSLLYLAPRLERPFSAVGVTLSPVQARQAHRNLAAFSQCATLVGDFQHLPLPDAALDLAFSIEAFIHAPSADRYLSEAARVLKPGGRLFLCDDFLTEARAVSPAEARLLDEYRTGWLAASLLPTSAVVERARAAGLRLIERRELTPHLKLRALPAPLAHGVLGLRRALRLGAMLATSTTGSIALQQCLASGAIVYQTLLFELAER